MKETSHSKNLLLLAAVTAGVFVSPNATAQMAEEETPFVSGSLTFAVDTHFISYGADVWGTGRSWGDPLFHPSLELGFDLGKGWSAVLGTWWDINYHVPKGSVHSIQEVDVWTGLAYSTGAWSFSLTYQEWMYGGSSERILDFGVGYDHWLNPSLVLHSRIDGEGLGLDEGIVPVVGIAPGKDFESFSLSFPLNVAFATDDYFGGDGGFAFASLGVGASVPLPFTRGDWTLDAGVTGYYTDDDVYPGNVDHEFITGTIGVSLAF